MSILAERILEQRIKMNITQEELGKRFGVTHAAVGMWERDKRRPDPVTLGKLADFFNVSVDYLLGRTDNPRVSRSAKTAGLPPDIRRIARAGERMTEEQREAWLRVAKALYPEIFKEEDLQ